MCIRDRYLAGQATIPSDTACFPAKLSHGHIKALSQMHLDAIFYPCRTDNFDEGLGDNHYNCPVVAYYPEVLAGNCPELEGQKLASRCIWLRALMWPWLSLAGKQAVSLGMVA